MSDSGLPSDPAELLALGRRLLAAQPFSVLVGATIDVFQPGHAELSLPIRPELLQQHGGVHGGVLSYLADNAMTFAGGSVLGVSVVTAEYKINYLRQARAGLLRAVASVESSGSRLAVTRCEIAALDGDSERTVAVAQGTIATVNAS